MKRLSRRLFLLLALAAVLGLAPAARAQELSYMETFDKDAPGWKLSEAWQLSSGLLLGRGAGQAVYAETTWDAMRYTVVVRSMTGAADLRFHYDGGLSYYALRLTTLSSSLVVELVRERLGEDGFTLGSAEFFVDQGDLQEQGLTLEATVANGAISVAGNGETVIEVVDKEPLPGGYIAFDLTENSFVAVDSVSVEPPGGASVQRGFDLAVQSVHVERFERGSVIVVLAVEVANVGFGPSPAFDLAVFDADSGESHFETISPLGGGEQRSLTLRLEGPDDWQETDRNFIAVIDPDGALGESDMENNRSETGFVGVPSFDGEAAQPEPPFVPPGQPTPQPGIDPTLLFIGGIVAVGGLAAVAMATGLAVRQQFKIGQRRQWEKKAKQGRPGERCAPPGYYVEVEPSLDLKPMRLSQVTVAAIELGRETVRRRQEVKGGTPNTLKLAIVGRWLGDPDASASARMVEAARDLSKAVSDLLSRETAPCDLLITARAEGIEAKARFTLYRCVKQGGEGVWKKVESWEKSKTQARDDVIARLPNRDPQATQAPGSLAAELEPLVRKYVEGYRAL